MTFTRAPNPIGGRLVRHDRSGHALLFASTSHSEQVA